MIMKALYLISGSILFALSGVLAPASFAQRSASRWTNYDGITTYRIGTQAVGWNELNQALQQAGYSALPGQLTTLGVASQFSRGNKPLAFHSELGLSLRSGMTVNNGTYQASARSSYIKFGVSYKIFGTDRFQIAPQLSLLTMPFQLQVKKINSTTPSLNTVLTNPGSAETASLHSQSIGLDAGLTATLRIPYNQRQSENDCSVSTVQRSWVIGLDAGYRIASRSRLNSGQEISAGNPAIQLSGWYAGLRIGVGTRVRSTKISPVVP